MRCTQLLLLTMIFLTPHDGHAIANPTDTLQFSCNELLCRPTATSVTIHACANLPLDAYCEYGPDSLNYQYQTNVVHTLDSLPILLTLQNLQPNTDYFYRLLYRQSGDSTYHTRSSHWFHTQRPRGTSFTFAIEADPHLDTNSNPPVYAQTLQNILARHPDFLLDLGDTFMSEKQPVISPATIRARQLLLRSYFDMACHSVPLFLVQGNHDGELGWRRDSTADNMPVWATNSRKLYFPNPVPDSFYSGDSISEPFVGLRENYYAWEWGNALFVVLDPYWYTPSKPGWGWTLGVDQYNWFKRVLETSTAKFKFVFCHQLVGGNGNDARGGVEVAHLFESGGRNIDSTWGFGTNRPGWEKPIHTLMVENQVSAYFHGHDHFFGYQQKDGIVYQEVPQPSLRSFTSIQATQYGYVNGVFIPNRGYLAVTVTDSNATVEYVRTYLLSEETSGRHNGDVSYTYSIAAPSPGTATVGIPLAAGWNLVSNPVTVANDSVRPLFPPSVYPYAFGYGASGYSQTFRMSNCVGYWLKCGAPTMQSVTGGKRVSDSIAVTAGWNIVGSVSKTVDTSSISSTPPGILASPLFEYSGGYITPAQITPGRGYWVRVNAPGVLRFADSPTAGCHAPSRRCSNILTGQNGLTISDNRGNVQSLYFGVRDRDETADVEFTMPPCPPEGGFDARFVSPGGGTMVRTYPADMNSDLEMPIAIQSGAGPLTISWTIVDGSTAYSLGSALPGDHDMKGEGSIRTGGGILTTVSIRVHAGAAKPREFGLQQNYPNPFNPLTTIRYSLPTDSRVTLRIFNILGQEIETLIHEDQKAGDKSIEWNGSMHASGVYYCRMQAGSFIATRKILLLK